MTLWKWRMRTSCLPSHRPAEAVRVHPRLNTRQVVGVLVEDPAERYFAVLEALVPGGRGPLLFFAP